MTLGLVIASTILLVVGWAQNALGFIYVSMLCAGVAAAALFVFARLARRRATYLAGAGLVAEPAGAGAAGSAAVAREGAARRGRRGAEDFSAATVTAPVEPIPDPTGGTPVVAAGDDFQRGSWADDEAGDWGDEVVFPIEDYDDLRVNEILPLLTQLDPDELEEVRDREMAGKKRTTVLARIEDRLSKAVDDEVTEVLPEPPAPAATAPAPAKKAPAKKAPAKKAPAANKAAPAQRAGTPRKPPSQ